MTDEKARIEPGQVWRRKSDGSRLFVVEVDTEWDDVTYRRLYPSGDQSRKQQIFGCNLRRRYVLTEPEEARDA